MHSERRDRFGLIDKQGNWTLDAEYFSIVPRDTFWIVDNGREQSVIIDNMQTVIPFIAGRMRFNDNMILATMSDHTVKTFSLQGEIIDNFCIRSVEDMIYKTSELCAATNLSDETFSNEVCHVQATAKCKRYEAEWGWYGLMIRDGKVLTLPSYSSIEAIDADLYLCKRNDDCGILLNGKGEKVY